MTISTAVDLSAVARVIGIKTNFVNLRASNVVFLPQRIAVVGQGSTAAAYSTTKAQYTRANDVGAAYGYGSPLHQVAKQLLPNNGDGVGSIPVTFYPMVDAGGAAAAVGGVLPSGSTTGADTIEIQCSNVSTGVLAFASGLTVAQQVTALIAAVNAIVDMPVVASGTTSLVLTSKWKGASANDIKVEVMAGSGLGITYGITQPVGGSGNPDVSVALAQMGNVWETLVLNCLNISDTVSLGLINGIGEGRWGALVRKPFVAFTGNTIASVSSATAVSAARASDRVNAQLVSPGSTDLPCVVAARQLARIAVIANNNPARDYAGVAATGLVPGPDGSQWLYTERDQAVKGGSSTVEIEDGNVMLSDTVTFYAPANDPTPAYRYVCDIVKLQNIIFNISLIFATQEWNGAPLIPDEQPTVNPEAKKPKAARAAAAALLDSLGLNALISDPATAKKNILCAISDQNPKRLDLAMTVQLSGNSNIIAVDLDFGFYFGVQPIVG